MADFFAVARSARNRIAILGDLAFVAMRHGHIAVIDAADVPVVAVHRWRAMTRPNGWATYACTNDASAMHRMLVVGLTHRQQVDHINRDGLDNRRANLRACTPRQNQHNKRVQRGSRSRFKGVSHAPWVKARPWMSRICIAGKLTYLGCFATEEAAARAYDAAAREHFGEFARPNFPDCATNVPTTAPTAPSGTRRAHA